MADVDFDFFEEPTEGSKSKINSDLSPRSGKHGSKKKIETKIPIVRPELSSEDSEDESPRSGRQQKHSNKSVKVAVDSSDSESESGSSSDDKPANVKKNAWSEDKKSGGVRPKSAHPAGRSSRHSNRPENSAKTRSRSESSSRSRSRSRSRSKSGSRSSRSRSRSDSDSSDNSTSSGSSSTDSDITHVSPLPSPKSSARSTSRKGKTEPKYGSMRPPKSPSVKSERSNRSRPSSGKLNKLLRPDQDTMDLKLLMQAVLEMEKERDREEMLLQQPTQPRFYVPQSSSKKKNMSFRNEKTREIDQENTRLMQQIVRYAAEAKKKKRESQRIATQRRTQPMVGRVLTTSAVNRKREQERIERENRAMLKRLEGAKATSTLSKDKLINQFNNQKMAGIPMGAVHPLERKKKGFRSPSPYDDYSRSKSSIMSDTSSIKSSSTWKSSASGRPIRPQSAKVTSTQQRPLSGKKNRPTSAKMTTSSRPEWESGW